MLASRPIAKLDWGTDGQWERRLVRCALQSNRLDQSFDSLTYTKACFCLLLAYRLDVAVQEAHQVDALDGRQDLSAQPQRGGDREDPLGHGSAQVGQIPPLGTQRCFIVVMVSAIRGMW